MTLGCIFNVNDEVTVDGKLGKIFRRWVKVHRTNDKNKILVERTYTVKFKSGVPVKYPESEIKKVNVGEDGLAF